MLGRQLQKSKIRVFSCLRVWTCKRRRAFSRKRACAAKMEAEARKPTEAPTGSLRFASNQTSKVRRPVDFKPGSQSSCLGTNMFGNQKSVSRPSGMLTCPSAKEPPRTPESLLTSPTQLLRFSSSRHTAFFVLSPRPGSASHTVLTV